MCPYPWQYLWRPDRVLERRTVVYNTHMHTHTCTHTHMHTHMHTHTQMYTHAHTQIHEYTIHTGFAQAHTSQSCKLQEPIEKTACLVESITCNVNCKKLLPYHTHLSQPWLRLALNTPCAEYKSYCNHVIIS